MTTTSKVVLRSTKKTVLPRHFYTGFLVTAVKAIQGREMYYQVKLWNAFLILFETLIVWLSLKNSYKIIMQRKSQISIGFEPLKPISTRRQSWRTFSWAARKLSIVWYSNFLIPQPLGFAQLECPLYGVHFSEKGNDLTNTLKIQRIPINLTLTLAKVTTKTVKRTKPRRRIALQRGSLMRWNSRKALFQAVFGHRKSPP